MQISSPGRRTLLNRFGAVVLFVGICLGAFLYWSAPPVRDGSDAVYDDSTLSPEDTRRYAHDTEVNFGKVGMLVDGGMRAVAKLGEPRPLGITIIIASALVAGGCFLAGAEKRTRARLEVDLFEGARRAEAFARYCKSGRRGDSCRH